VRGYLAVGLSTNNIGFDNAGNTFSSNRAFIQWAGFTFGLTQSFFDFYNSPATSYWGSFPASDTGDGGWMVAAYTAQFGNGFSGSIAAEMRRTTQIVNSGTFVRAGTGAFPGDYGGFQSPDVVANLRVDQAWGSAQVMGAIHQVNATYYGGPNAVSSGHPDDDVGFAVGAGLRLNAPMISQGDYLQAQINYTQGARYIFQTPNSNYGKVEGADLGFGVLSDAVYGGTIVAGNASQLSLTTAWNVNAAYEHFWNPQWRTSLYGGYAAVSYNDQGNRILCSLLGAGAGSDVPNNVLPINVVTGNATTASDADNWQFRFRVHRNFYP
jgi:porin-like protein